MLTKAVVFLFSVMAVFGVIVNGIPADFTAQQTATYGAATDKAVASYFDMNNFTVYGSQAHGNMTGYGWSNKTIPSGISPTDWIEIYWTRVDVQYVGSTYGFQIKHATEQWYGRSGHELSFSSPQLLEMDFGPALVTVNDLVGAWDATYNGSYFDAYCEHLALNIIFQPTDPTKDIFQAFQANAVSFSMSYEVDLNATGVSIWTLVGNLFAFRTPDIGLPGIANDIIGGAVGAAMWALVAIVIYKVTTGIIPWLSGGSGD